MTTDTPESSIPESSDLLAAEFVLGCLDARQLRQVAARSQRDPGFAGLVESWSVRLSPLNDALEPHVPDESLWQGIEQHLPQPQDLASARPQFYGISKAGFFGWGAAALAASFALMLLIPGDLSHPSGRAVAILEIEEGALSWAFTVERRGSAVTVRRQGAPLQAAGHSLELWLVSVDGGVESLGLVPQADAARIPLAPPILARMVTGATLAISLEPLGGSLSGQPSGPVVASAVLASD